MILTHAKTRLEVEMPTMILSDLLFGAQAYGWTPSSGESYVTHGPIWAAADCAGIRAALVKLYPGACTWQSATANEEFRTCTHHPRTDRRLAADPDGQWDRSPIIVESVGRWSLVELALLIRLLEEPGNVQCLRSPGDAQLDEAFNRAERLTCPVRMIVGIQINRAHIGPASGVVELSHYWARQVVTTGRGVPVIDPVPVPKKRGAAA